MTRTYRSDALDLDALRSEIDLLEPSTAVAVAVLDLDGFGPVNDEQGPTEGDALLGRCEEAMRTALPASALIAHIRGDEFAVALPDAPPESLLIALEQARQAIDAAESVTLSGGVAGRPQHGASTDELLSAADTALVRAKRDGANRIAIAVDERMVLKTSYYAPAALHRLAKLARRTGRPEASLLREALDDLLAKHRDAL
jgi:diguanylate cyclase (GGDEF)-like protein